MKKPIRIRSVCWEGENTSRMMANQAMRVLGSTAKFDKKKSESRRKTIKYNGRDVHLSIHGVWRPVKSVGGLDKQTVKNTDIFLVPHRGMFFPGSGHDKGHVDLWKNEDVTTLLKEHEKRGNIIVVHEEMNDADLRKEILKRV